MVTVPAESIPPSTFHQYLPPNTNTSHNPALPQRLQTEVVAPAEVPSNGPNINKSIEARDIIVTVPAESIPPSTFHQHLPQLGPAEETSDGSCSPGRSLFERAEYQQQIDELRDILVTVPSPIDTSTNRLQT